MSDVSRETLSDEESDATSASPTAAPSGAAVVFGARMPAAERFVTILADTGVSHGLIGPREVPRLWQRHVLNCAVVEAAFPASARLIDVGSGAGLPGIALAIARPDLDVHLVEPMQRRTDWLSATVAELELDNVTVHRGRAEELDGVVAAPWVTARAVARIAKLARWCVPLLDGGGTLVALKGRSAQAELDADRRDLTRLGLVEAAIRQYGESVLEEPTITLDLSFEPRPRRGKPVGRGRRGKPPRPTS